MIWKIDFWKIIRFNIPFTEYNKMFSSNIIKITSLNKWKCVLEYVHLISTGFREEEFYVIFKIDGMFVDLECDIWFF